MKYEIQPLRISSGWTIELNNFCECDPDNCDNFCKYLIEDLLQLAHKRFNLVIDLGWYPDLDPNGCFHLVLIKDFKWENPLEIFESRKPKDVIEKIEYWSNYSFYQKYL